MTAQSYDIQELVELSGVARRNIYFYVQQGLLPPPQGAGLAARYGQDHLLRLRLIPLLRRQGLRLDQIREKLVNLGTAEMEQLIDQAQQISQPVEPINQLRIKPQFQGGQSCKRYDFPGGIVLLVPDGLSPLYHGLAERLIRVASGDRVKGEK
jgi:DNA-binding transcriptional MerR regulator